jgi:hypothetical protein
MNLSINPAAVDQVTPHVFVHADKKFVGKNEGSLVKLFIKWFDLQLDFK